MDWHLLIAMDQMRFLPRYSKPSYLTSRNLSHCTYNAPYLTSTDYSFMDTYSRFPYQHGLCGRLSLLVSPWFIYCHLAASASKAKFLGSFDDSRTPYPGPILFYEHTSCVNEIFRVSL